MLPKFCRLVHLKGSTSWPIAQMPFQKLLLPETPPFLVLKENNCAWAKMAEVRMVGNILVFPFMGLCTGWDPSHSINGIKASKRNK